MSVCMAGFALNDTFIKGLGGIVPLWQAVFLRGVLVCILLYAYLKYRGKFTLAVSRNDGILIVVRGICEAAAAFFFLTSLFHLPFATVSAVLQALPLTVTLGSAVFFREPVGWRRWTAIFVGLYGVLMIVSPENEHSMFWVFDIKFGSEDGSSIYMLYVLGAVAAATVRDLAARRLSRDVPSVMAAWVTAVIVTIAGGVGSLVGDWVTLDAVHYGAIAGAAVFVLIAYIFSVAAVRTGEISFVSPFRYTGLLFSLMLGALVFAEWPPFKDLVGAVIVVGAGVFTLYRETRAKRAEQRALAQR